MDQTRGYYAIGKETTDYNFGEDANWYVEIIKLGRRLPFIEITYENSFYAFWLFALLAFGIVSKRYDYLIGLLALFAQWGICLLSPVNGSARYAMALFYGIPVFLICYLSPNQPLEERAESIKN